MRFSDRTSQGPWRSIVGVAADVKNGGLVVDADPEFYIPWKEDSQAFVQHSFVIFLTALKPATVIPWIREQIAQIDPTTPVEFSTMTERVGQLTERPRFDALLLMLFAAIAVLLAALGIYGVVGFFVSQRTQEIGVRMALGATPLGISKMVLSNVARWTIAGAAAGLLGSWFCARLMQSLLFNVSPHDPILLGLALLLLLAVAFFSAWIPARRASHVDPLTALRHE
jgi:putative ABC transport system permease protein